MKVGALVLGIIGGLFALSLGLLGFGLGSMMGGSGAGLQLVSIGVPVLGLIGAGMVMSKPQIGASLMAFAAVVLVVILGFNFISLIPVVLLGIGAVLGFVG